MLVHYRGTVRPFSPWRFLNLFIALPLILTFSSWLNKFQSRLHSSYILKEILRNKLTLTWGRAEVLPRAPFVKIMNRWVWPDLFSLSSTSVSLANGWEIALVLTNGILPSTYMAIYRGEWDIIERDDPRISGFHTQVKWLKKSLQHSSMLYCYWGLSKRIIVLNRSSLHFLQYFPFPQLYQLIDTRKARYWWFGVLCRRLSYTVVNVLSTF